MRKKANGFISPYRNYMFIDKDPIIDFTRTAVERSKKSYQSIHDSTNVSTTTLYNWFGGKTRRPQFASIAAVLIECGVRDIPLSVIAKRKIK
jgi:hypothetical protein